MRCGVPSALYSTVTWLLASGRSELQLAGLAQLGVVLDQAVRQVDRQRHQRLGLVAGEAEHHALVAGAADVHAHGDVAATGRAGGNRPGRCRPRSRWSGSM